MAENTFLDHLSDEVIDYGDGSSYGWNSKTVSTKVDEDTHTSLIELGNRHGGVSAVIRAMILRCLADGVVSDASDVEYRMRATETRIRNKDRAKHKLGAGYYKLLKDPNPEYEEQLKELAAKYGFEYPPTLGKLYTYDSDLRTVMERTQDLWDKGEGVTTIRDLNRSLHRYSADQLKQHLLSLADMGEVVVQQGSRSDSWYVMEPRLVSVFKENEDEYADKA